MGDLTKQEYEEELNDVSPYPESDEWIIGGKRRVVYSNSKKFGTATRKYDQVGFNVGYNCRKREVNGKL